MTASPHGPDHDVGARHASRLQYVPDLATALSYQDRMRLMPVYREALADLDTPVSAYLKLAGDGPGFLLESIEGGERLGRYSFVGFDIDAWLEIGEGGARLTRSGVEESLVFEDPLELIDRLVFRPDLVRLKRVPRFLGGAVGYLSYEIARYFERIPQPTPDPFGLPLAHLMLVDTLLVFDHVRRTALIVTHVPLDGDVTREYMRATEKIERVLDRLQRPVPSETVAMLATGAGLPPTSNLSRGEFEAGVRRAKDHIAVGDVIQVVLSQRLSVRTGAQPFSVYRALRTVNPSPYMYFLNFGGHQLIGASPELLVLVEDANVTTHPIAGTRPRGNDEAEDQMLAEELLANEKERAEHVMLVDLGRNDIGRVSVPGTVHVPHLMQIERYSHVMHIVSHVTGRLRPDLRPIDALRACFPAGTVSGAPKIRAMEIIAELEPERRGPYAGGVGFFGMDGDLETAITIRTILMRDGMAHVQAGAGIVADSEPSAEYVETLNKAEALLAAVRAAEAEEARRS